MTIVAAWTTAAGAVTLAADTMVSHGGRDRDSRIAGTLKVVVIDPRLPVAFAGHVDTARRAIRHIHGLSAEGAPLGAMLFHLSEISGEGRCDFLVASHEPAPALRKIRRGRVSDPQAFHWIGDPAPLAAMQAHVAQAEAGHAVAGDALPTGLDRRASALESGFCRLFATDPCHGDTVGGLPIILDVAADGYHYRN